MLAVTLLVSGGFAASSTLGAPSPQSQTVTVAVPQSGQRTVTLTVADQQEALESALSDPARVSAVADAATRRALTAELRDLDAFLAARPKLRPYRTHIWYVAHHARWHLTARQVAAVLWCTVWFPTDCR